MNIADISSEILAHFSVRELQRYNLALKSRDLERQIISKEYVEFSASTPNYNFAAAIRSKKNVWIEHFKWGPSPGVGANMAAAINRLDLVLFFGGDTTKQIEIAAERGHFDMVKFLVNRMKKDHVRKLFDESAYLYVNQPEAYAMSGAVKGNHMNIIEYALNNGVSPNLGMSNAVSCNNLPLVKYFIHKGANEVGQSITNMMNSMSRHITPNSRVDGEMLEYLFARGNDRPTHWGIYLAIAAASGRMDLVELCIANGGNDWDLAVDYAIFSRDVGMVKFCLEKEKEYYKQRINPRGRDTIEVDIHIAERIECTEILEYFGSIGAKQSSCVISAYAKYDVGGYEVFEYIGQYNAKSKSKAHEWIVN